MADNYLGFTYNDIHSFNSGVFTCYITNEGELEFFNTPSFSPEFAFPKFTNSSYYLGTNKENRTFNLNLIVLNITMSNYRKFLKWLSIDNDPAFLKFDYESNFQYNVIVSGITEGRYTINKNGIETTTYNIELTASFTTVGDWAAQAIIGSSDNLIGGNYFFPNEESSIFTSVETGLSFNITNNSSLPVYFNIEFNDTFTITFDGDDFYILSETDSSVLYTKYAVAIDDDGDFIEFSDNLGILKIDPGETKTMSYSGSITKIIPIIREII